MFLPLHIICFYCCFWVSFHSLRKAWLEKIKKKKKKVKECVGTKMTSTKKKSFPTIDR